MRSTDIVTTLAGIEVGIRALFRQRNSEESVNVQQRRLWGRLRRKGGKAHAMLCHHTLEAYLHAYLVSRRHRPRERAEGATLSHDRAQHRAAEYHALAGVAPVTQDRRTPLG